LTRETENHVPQICLPEDHPTVDYRYTLRSSAQPGVLLGVFYLSVSDH